MIWFAHGPGAPGEPVVDGNEGTLYSGLSNIDMEIQDGNPAAIAVRAHFAQHSALAHVDFRIGSALGAVEEIGHEIEDCRFFGGEFAIRTAVTAAGWQSLVFDSEFVGQRSVAIETHEAGMTVIRSRFRNVPYGIRIPVMRVSHLTGESTDKLYVKDSRFENIKGAALWVARYYDPKTQINVDDVECDRRSRVPGVQSVPGRPFQNTGKQLEDPRRSGSVRHPHSFSRAARGCERHQGAGPQAGYGGGTGQAFLDDSDSEEGFPGAAAAIFLGERGRPGRQRRRRRRRYRRHSGKPLRSTKRFTSRRGRTGSPTLSRWGGIPR